MDNFEFYSPTRFVFGRGAEEKTGALVRTYGGTKALLHFGGGSVKANGVYSKVVASLEAAGVAYVPLGGVQPNPRSGLVREGIALCRREKIDFVLAVGGGSVIDSAKAIAFGTLYDGDFADFYFGKDVKRPTPVPAALPIGTVLTIAAAGSEGSGNSIITLEPDMLKRGATGDALRPAFSILNPEFTFTLPAYQTACGATDMFAHVVERYFTPTRDVAVSDELCEGLMRTIVAESRKVMSAPRDYAARANLMWAGLSAFYGCAHGAGLAVVMPAWMDYVKDVDIPRFARFAAKVFGVPEGDPAAMAAEGIRRYRAWLRDLGMPLTFEELGAKKEDIPALVAKLGLNGNTVGTFKPLSEVDVTRILESC